MGGQLRRVDGFSRRQDKRRVCGPFFLISLSRGSLCLLLCYETKNSRARQAGRERRGWKTGDAEKVRREDVTCWDYGGRQGGAGKRDKVSVRSEYAAGVRDRTGRGRDSGR